MGVVSVELHARPRASARRHPLLFALHVVAAAVGEVVRGCGQKKRAGRAKAAVFSAQSHRRGRQQLWGGRRRPSRPPSRPALSKRGPEHACVQPARPPKTHAAPLNFFLSSHLVRERVFRARGFAPLLQHALGALAVVGHGDGKRGRVGGGEKKVATIARSTKKRDSRVSFFFVRPSSTANECRRIGKRTGDACSSILHDCVRTQKKTMKNGGGAFVLSRG